jgi:hypothetical protein
MKVKQFKSSGEVRRELSLLYSQVKSDTLVFKKAEVMKGLLNAILISISVDIKEKNLQAQQNLLEEIQGVRGGNK